MPKVSKFTKEQKLEIALEFLSGKLSRGEVGRQHGPTPGAGRKRRARRTYALHAILPAGVQGCP